MSLLLLAAAALALAAAAVSDLRTRKLPNSLTAVVAAAAVARHLAGGASLPLGWPGALAALLAGLALYRAKVMGAGDVKLISACLLWFPGRLAADYLFLVSFLGGLMAVGVMAASKIRRRKAQGVPYGPAIGGAALAVMAA
jgi:prepilin peptidase CpaA